MREHYEPDLIPCRYGGWLAVSHPKCPIKIGVNAATEPDARVAYVLALQRWQSLLSDHAEDDDAQDGFAGMDPEA